MIKTIYEYNKCLAKADYHKRMAFLNEQQLCKTSCTDTAEINRLRSAMYYHRKRHITMLNKSHAVLDRKVVE